MTFIKGHYYHIYNRGCNKEPIFFNDGNYIYLLRKMQSTFQQCGANIIAYCLMPNHYHFLIQQVSDISLSDWLHKIFVGYTQAVNKQQKRGGTLFQGRPKHKLVAKEEYLDYLMWYIHVNPVAAGIVARCGDWKYSNYLECIGKRNGVMINKEFIIQRFGSMRKYEEFVENFQPDPDKKKEYEKYLLD